ncbi:peptidoglycan-binding protein [Bifidobacterium catenulatum]|uniref:Peptidoglycan-binding protein n=1 Tax=Bifidobacterium catenulatum PV20-2 TaxID=1447716 RepID=A0A0A7I482_9BIFI|nr:peptidoglycan-binding protein [Bifidobacterium catenulatum]AIZ15182.1 peptidoglycan-binding protein [Bifidobacterium catenulatum PV20-2]
MKTRILTPLILTGLGMLSAGVLATALIIPTPTPDGLASPTSPDTVTASRQQFADERTVEASFETIAEQPITSRAAGTVSETLCTPGQTFESGTRLLSVDGRPIIALHTDTPLYREIGTGDSGPDVLALQQELARLGYNAEGNGTYGWRTADGVRQLFSRAGKTNPDGRIGPADVAWLPQTSATPTQCTAGLNMSLADGAEIMKTGGQLIAVTFPTPANLSEGKRTFTLFGVKTSLDADGIGKTGGRISDQKFLDQIQASDGYKTTLADQGGKKPTATLALEQPIDTTKVPPSAITGQNGTHACVSSDGKQAIPVTVIGSALGATLVQPEQADASIDKVVLGHKLDKVQCPTETQH